MGREHSPETVFRAQELYCVDRLTFAQVAGAIGVAESTAKRWSETYGWQAKRQEIAQAEADLRADFILGRSKMLKKLIEHGDAQVGFAVAGLEGLAMKQAEALRQGRQIENAAAAQARPLREIKTDADAVAALEEALAIRLNQVLADPARLDLKIVCELRKAIDLVQGMRKGAAKGEQRRKGLTLEMAEAARRDILGVGQ